MSDKSELNQAGFNAIADAVRRLYPGQEGLYYGTIIPAFLGGNDPLDGVEVWKSDRGVPHWHYITYGFTELFEKESGDAEISGYGFELTFRLKRGEEEQPPTWPISLLQNMGRYVFSSGNVFGPGHYIDCNSPIALETDTLLTALGFQTDPELGELDTPNGHFAFLQAVGLTGDEMDAMMCWNGQKFLAALAEWLPLCVTDLSRPSMMDDPVFHTVWQEGMKQDGSSTASLYLDEVGMQIEDGRGYLRLGAGRGQLLARMLRARTGKGRPLLLQSQEAAVQCRSGNSCAVSSEEDGVFLLTLTEHGLTELCDALQRHTGRYPLSSIPLTVELVPTQITDQEGNIIRVIE